MMRRRLFWKLFLAFWLANCLTFLAVSYTHLRAHET